MRAQSTMTTTYPTTDGGMVTDHQAAFTLAHEIAFAAGFEMISASAQSRSAYFSRPGNSRVLRISDHANYHPGRNEEVVEARLTPIRAEIVRIWNDDIEGEIKEEDYIGVIAETPMQISTIIARAIEEYDQ